MNKIFNLRKCARWSRTNFLSTAVAHRGALWVHCHGGSTMTYYLTVPICVVLGHRDEDLLVEILISFRTKHRFRMNRTQKTYMATNWHWIKSVINTVPFLLHTYIVVTFLESCIEYALEDMFVVIRSLQKATLSDFVSKT